MPTTQILPQPPSTQGSNLSATDYLWMLIVQGLEPLYEVDTSKGSYSENAPPAGLASATGQSAQAKEITYVKTSADGNVFTLKGVQGGPYTLGAQYSSLKIKSDGTNWWLASLTASAVPGALNFADEETPAGAIDGVNKVFTLGHTPNPAASLQLFNGLMQKPGGNDYTLAGNTITFTAAPSVGSTLLAWYRY